MKQTKKTSKDIEFSIGPHIRLARDKILTKFLSEKEIEGLACKFYADYIGMENLFYGTLKHLKKFSPEAHNSVITLLKDYDLYGAGGSFVDEQISYPLKEGKGFVLTGEGIKHGAWDGIEFMTKTFYLRENQSISGKRKKGKSIKEYAEILTVEHLASSWVAKSKSKNRYVDLEQTIEKVRKQDYFDTQIPLVSSILKSENISHETWLRNEKVKKLTKKIIVNNLVDFIETHINQNSNPTVRELKFSICNFLLCRKNVKAESFQKSLDEARKFLPQTLD